MQTEGSFEERLALLPKDLQDLLAGIPREKAEEVLGQLLQPAELRYEALEAHHVDIIKVSCAL